MWKLAAVISIPPILEVNKDFEKINLINYAVRTQMTTRKTLTLSSGRQTEVPVDLSVLNKVYTFGDDFCVDDEKRRQDAGNTKDTKTTNTDVCMFFAPKNSTYCNHNKSREENNGPYKHQEQNKTRTHTGRRLRRGWEGLSLTSWSRTERGRTGQESERCEINNLSNNKCIHGV